MAQLDVYVYGMALLSTIHRLDGPFPPADAYQEIAETRVVPGGEGANGAVLLAGFGMSVALDGCHTGADTDGPLKRLFADLGVDASRLTPLPDFPGWRDIVFCDGRDRTVFGWFGRDLFSDRRLWTVPDPDAIRDARWVALDPFFGDASREVAELCVAAGTPYATVDCGLDSTIARRARALVCSREFLDRQHPGADLDALLADYHQACDGLVVFTSGSEPIRFWAPGEDAPSRCLPPKIGPVDTLGAGDAFRAGIVYALATGMPDSDAVRFAAALSAAVCLRFPSVYPPPSLAEVRALLPEGEVWDEVSGSRHPPRLSAGEGD